MRMADPLAVAEAAQDPLDRFGEVTICAEFGHGWSCMQPATPDGGCSAGGASPAIGTTSKPWHPTGTSDAR
jgi:hypothetical protein